MQKLRVRKLNEAAASIRARLPDRHFVRPVKICAGP
jgi:hypothetical protein